MNRTYFIILFVGIALALLFDVIASLASRKFQFDVRKTSFISLLLQLGITAYAALRLDTMAAVTIGGMMALADAIFGYMIAMKLQPQMSEEEKMALEAYAEDGKPRVSIVIFLTLMGLFVGWVGAMLAKFLQ